MYKLYTKQLLIYRVNHRLCSLTITFFDNELIQILIIGTFKYIRGVF
jgi:hypothetical protein